MLFAHHRLLPVDHADANASKDGIAADRQSGQAMSVDAEAAPRPNGNSPSRPPIPEVAVYLHLLLVLHLLDAKRRDDARYDARSMRARARACCH